MQGIIGRKLGMTQIFDDEGTAIPVTVIEAGPCPVVQVKNVGGADVVQLGFGQRKAKHSTKAAMGHARAAGLDAAPATLRDFRVPGGSAAPKQGELVTAAIFQPGDVVKVTGVTKGRGFQGVVKRHGFGGGPATHGNTRHRKPGSVGPGTDPSRVIKGKRMPGHMGASRHTEVSLRVVRVDPAENLVFVRGAVPGHENGIVLVRKQPRRGRYA
jgi:large subunit ribosomal protein L3